MTNDATDPDGKAAQLQEAVDTIAQAFGYPSSLSVHYAVTDGAKRSTFEIEVDDETSTYELRYDGRRDDTEPELLERE